VWIYWAKRKKPKKNPKKHQTKKNPKHQNILPILFGTRHVAWTLVSTAYSQLVMQKLTGLTIQLKAMA